MLRAERDKLPTDKKNFVLTQFPRFLSLLEEELRNATSPVWDPMFKLCDLSAPSVGTSGAGGGYDRPLPSPITLIHSPTPSETAAYSPLHSPNKPTCSPRFHCAPVTPSGSASPVGSERACSALFGHNGGGGGGGKRRISERLKRSNTAFCNLAGDSDWVLEEGSAAKRSRLGGANSHVNNSFQSTPCLYNLTSGDESFSSMPGGGYWSEVEGDITEEELRDVRKEIESREEVTSHLDSPTTLVSNLRC